MSPRSVLMSGSFNSYKEAKKACDDKLLELNKDQQSKYFGSIMKFDYKFKE